MYDVKIFCKSYYRQRYKWCRYKLYDIIYFFIFLLSFYVNFYKNGLSDRCTILIKARSYRIISNGFWILAITWYMRRLRQNGSSTHMFFFSNLGSSASEWLVGIPCLKKFSLPRAAEYCTTWFVLIKCKLLKILLNHWTCSSKQTIFLEPRSFSEQGSIHTDTDLLSNTQLSILFIFYVIFKKKII